MRRRVVRSNPGLSKTKRAAAPPNEVSLASSAFGDAVTPQTSGTHGTSAIADGRPGVKAEAWSETFESILVTGTVGAGNGGYTGSERRETLPERLVSIGPRAPAAPLAALRRESELGHRSTSRRGIDAFPRRHYLLAPRGVHPRGATHPGTLLPG